MIETCKKKNQKNVPRKEKSLRESSVAALRGEENIVIYFADLPRKVAESSTEMWQRYCDCRLQQFSHD